MGKRNIKTLPGEQVLAKYRYREFTETASLSLCPVTESGEDCLCQNIRTPPTEAPLIWGIFPTRYLQGIFSFACHSQPAASCPQSQSQEVERQRAKDLCQQNLSSLSRNIFPRSLSEESLGPSYLQRVSLWDPISLDRRAKIEWVNHSTWYSVWGDWHPRRQLHGISCCNLSEK